MRWVDSSSTDSSTAARTSASVASTNGTLIPKIQRQVAWSTSRPPPSGPITIAMPAQAVHVPIAAPRSSAGKVAVMTASEDGTSSAPAIPWSARAATSSSAVGASAQMTDVVPKPASPTAKIRRRPSRSPSEPPTSSKETSVSRKPVTIHCWVARPASRSSPIAGSATLTTVPSTNTTAEPRTHAISVRRLVRASATCGERDSLVKAPPLAVRLASARVHAEVANQPGRRAETPLRRLAGEARDGCWIVSEPSASWVDGGERDLAGILANASDLGSLSDELAAAGDTWVRRYHLASERGNIVRPLALLGSRVLEIGAGCGGVTRRLGEMAGVVDALEPTPARAAAARLRTRDLPSVEVFIGDVHTVPREPAYDAVILIGVLDYIGGADEGEARVAFLREAAARLLPGGTLVCAIENRLGVKYLAGAPEDNANLP